MKPEHSVGLKAGKAHAIGRPQSGMFACTAVLAAGLALLPGCKDAAAAPKPAPVMAQPSRAPLIQPTVDDIINYANKSLSEDISGMHPTVIFTEGEHAVRKGDSVLTVDFMIEKAGYFSVSVSGVYEKGVELVMNPGTFIQGRMRMKLSPLKIGYGETKTLDWFDPVLTIKAEKGTKAGTALLSITTLYKEKWIF
ncbi:hypothetical protein H0O00_04120 [Candidatus Micrarchaeota archaeon]|nr:hypothetical protein [Candidatus Micrarchaeota archaeon]